MKILVLTHEFPPIGGGGGHVAKDLCQGLAAAGYEIKVLSADLRGGVREDQDQSGRGYELIRTATLRKDPARASLPAMITYILSAVGSGLSLLRSWKPDLIHVHFAVPAGPIAWILSKISGVPYVMTVHLGDVPGGTPEKTRRWFKFVKPFTYPVWNDAQKVIAVSEFTRQLALDHYQVPIQVIYNGVDTARFAPARIEVHVPPRIVFAGRFVPQKSPLLVILALAELKDLEWELVMCGDGELYHEVKAEIQRWGLEDRARLPGWVSPDEVQYEFKRSDILLMPSLSEGLPVAGVQALASGLAFVVSDIGGFKDLVEQGENGFRVAMTGSDLPQLFAQPLMRLLSDHDQLKRCKESSLRLAKKFDLNEIISRYDQLFNQVINPDGR